MLTWSELICRALPARADKPKTPRIAQIHVPGRTSRSRMRLRFRLNVMILPVVVAVVLLGGVLTSLASRSALTRVANRHLTYKAEQLRDHAYSEWSILEDLGLADRPEYSAAARESFRSYARSLLRTRTELILVVDSGGEPVMGIGLGASEDTNEVPEATAESRDSVDLPVGWFSRELFGESRVGVGFELEPFDWTVAVTDRESAFFSEVQHIRATHGWILLAALGVVTLVTTAYVGYIVRPVERLATTIAHVGTTGNLSHRAEVEFADEIGVLASKFNTMIRTLEQNYAQLESTRNAEEQARKDAVDREEEALYLLGRASEFRDAETGEHLWRIGRLAALFSRLLSQGEREQELMRKSAPLHDVGKIGIPDALLLKPGKLEPEEFEQMKRHALEGYELLRSARSEYLIEGARIARTHHEKWDGSGYPDGLAEEEIPLSGRIVGLVDVFDALTSARPYKDPWPPERALKLIVEERGKHFDPHLVDIFEKHFAEFRAVIEED